MADKGVPFKIPDRYAYKGPRLAGGQGYVYIYQDTFLQRDVAIKVMKDPRDADELRGELSRIREIRSRHIVEIYDLFEAKRSNQVALVEEYVPGPTLEELATSGAILSENEATKLLWQIACGLADIHAHGIIHRDIKPQNIKRDAEGIIKILDLGISSVLAQHADTVNARGTITYLAPEMYHAPPIALTTDIDVYAFGVTTWHLLNGGKFPGPLNEKPPQSRNLAPSLQTASLVLPVRLTDLLDKALAPDPKDRPTMEGIRDILRSQITAGQHRLVLTYGGQQKMLHRAQRTVTLKVGVPSLTIVYDDINFVATNVVGDVYLNNTRIQVGANVPDSCVITFGDPGMASARTFVPMTILTPEVVL